jgi:hypothetical protein
MSPGARIDYKALRKINPEALVGNFIYCEVAFTQSS